jgi:ABC-type spermidine/putrescine transport system permease subunit II
MAAVLICVTSPAAMSGLIVGLIIVFAASLQERLSGRLF